MSVIDPAVSVRITAVEARRLVGLLGEVSFLLEDPGADRLTDPQTALLGQGAARRELAEWARAFAAELQAKL
ncbi:hypothetical protein [Streptomyces sp. NPDC051211]|uniref:hypothetical protein n=1 Tax=Streptomyces sp. NPDC051211 TaxID=3154643 RepID=UPI00344C813F